MERITTIIDTMDKHNAILSWRDNFVLVIIKYKVKKNVAGIVRKLNINGKNAIKVSHSTDKSRGSGSPYFGNRPNLNVPIRITMSQRDKTNTGK